VLALIEQARESIPQPLRSATYETLIGLLAATGLRIGEALRLDRTDVDWQDGVLRIRRSKFLKSRLVPLLASTVDALERYEHRRRQLCPEPSTESFFVSLRGTRVIYETVWPTHRMLCDQAGVGAGARFSPRVHEYADLLVMPMSLRRSCSERFRGGERRHNQSASRNASRASGGW
jgi:integrase/recombinase XerD